MKKDNIVVRFCGDSGDGMQLTGGLFSSLSAILGNEISTLPDFPAEIRAPQGTLGGVSGFQVNVGKGVFTPGDKADVIVAMNAAALKVCALGSKFSKQGATFNEADALFKKDAVVIVDTDSFTDADLKKALYTTDNPFTELGLPESVQVVPVALTNLTKEALKDSGMDNKAMLKSRNMFALGIVCWLFDRPIDKAIHFLEGKFAKKPALIAPNVKVLTDGFNYGQNLALSVNQIRLTPATEQEHGTYTSIAGNKATAWGLIAAAEKAGKRLFLGSYPITPATDIMHELAGRKDMNVMVVQAEDEIAGVCTAIGASFAGDLACTSTSGPGLSLKSEGIGLAVMAELPLVVIDVQRGGPSTGLPTKTEQTDLLQAIYGRKIKPQGVPEELKGKYNPALRDENGVRYMAIPGMEGFQYRNMGLERDAEKGSISTNPENHQRMILARQAKVDQVADRIPEAEVWGNADSDTLLVGFGSTEGHLRAAAKELNCALLQLNYICPLQRNVGDIIRSYKRVIVCELNSGQLAAYLRSQVPNVTLLQYNQMTAQPFQVEQIVDYVKEL